MYNDSCRRISTKILCKLLIYAFAAHFGLKQSMRGGTYYNSWTKLFLCYFWAQYLQKSSEIKKHNTNAERYELS